MKRERECVSEGKMKQDIKGAERLSIGREGKEKRRSGGGVGVFSQITQCTLLNSAGPHTHIKVVPPICPRLSRPLSTPHVTPYILPFMLNN